MKGRGLGVHLDIRKIDGDLAVEAARTHECLVQNIGAVGAGKNDNVSCASEAYKQRQPHVPLRTQRSTCNNKDRSTVLMKAQ
jgi:hypothetical protein